MTSSALARRFAAGNAASAPSFLVLVLLSGVGPLSTDMYLPALPAIGRSLGADAPTAQPTLTAFLVGLAAGQLLLGALRDSVGRRGFLIAGPAFFAVSSLPARSRRTPRSSSSPGSSRGS